MARRARGRPVGSSPTRDTDDVILRKAALLLITGRARNATQAFRDVLGHGDEHVIRRLQRRWRRDGDWMIADLQRPMWAQHWERDALALKHAAPHVYAKIEAFADSEGGSQVLAEHLNGRPPSQMMSLGIARLWELVEEHAPVGAAAADSAFATSYQIWSRYGAVPDSEFLKRFAELCLQRAQALESSGASDAITPDSGGVPS